MDCGGPPLLFEGQTTMTTRVAPENVLCPQHTDRAPRSRAKAPLPCWGEAGCGNGCTWAVRPPSAATRPAATFHDRLRASGKPPKVIHIALAHKLLRQAFAWPPRTGRTRKRSREPLAAGTVHCEAAPFASVAISISPAHLPCHLPTEKINSRSSTASPVNPFFRRAWHPCTAPVHAGSSKLHRPVTRFESSCHLTRLASVQGLA